MQEMDPPPVLVSRRGPPRRRRDPSAPATDLERVLGNHELATREEIERGVRAMYRGAVRLMRQVASEAWAAGGPEPEDRLRDRILHTLARDDAFRALLGQAEERHQALTLRLDRIETALRNLIRANREAVTRAEGSEVTRRLEAGMASLRSSLEAEMASVRRALAGSAPSPERIEEAAAPGAERAARAEVDRLEAALGRPRNLERAVAALQAVPERVPTTGTRSPGAPGAEQRLRELQRRLAWTSARLGAAGASGNGGPAT